VGDKDVHQWPGQADTPGGLEQWWGIEQHRWWGIQKHRWWGIQ